MEEDDSGGCRIKDQGTISELLRRGIDFSMLQNKEKSVEEDSNSAGKTSNDEAVEQEAVPSFSEVSQTPPAEVDSFVGTAELDADQMTSSLPPVISASGSPNEVTLPVPQLLAENFTPAPEGENSAMLPDKSDPNTKGDVDKPHEPLVTKTSVKTVIPPVVKSFTSTEERAEGAVGLSAYKSYLRAGSKPTLIIITLLSFFFANFSQIFQQWIVAAWTSGVYKFSIKDIFFTV
jgi:hypothetical protein